MQPIKGSTFVSAPLQRNSVAVYRRCVRGVEPGRTFPVPLSQGYAVRVQCFDAGGQRG
jgi:hypothetical protein